MAGPLGPASVGWSLLGPPPDGPLGDWDEPAGDEPAGDAPLPDPGEPLAGPVEVPVPMGLCCGAPLGVELGVVPPQAERMEAAQHAKAANVIRIAIMVRATAGQRSSGYSTGMTRRTVPAEMSVTYNSPPSSWPNELTETAASSTTTGSAPPAMAACASRAQKRPEQ